VSDQYEGGGGLPAVPPPAPHALAPSPPPPPTVPLSEKLDAPRGVGESGGGGRRSAPEASTGPGAAAAVLQPPSLTGPRAAGGISNASARSSTLRASARPRACGAWKMQRPRRARSSRSGPRPVQNGRRSFPIPPFAPYGPDDHLSPSRRRWPRGSATCSRTCARHTTRSFVWRRSGPRAPAGCRARWRLKP
jgi:hypothetical protein